MRRRRRRGPALWLVLAVLVVAAAALLWIVVDSSGGAEVGSGSADGPTAGASSTASASGWAPPTLSELEGAVLEVDAATRADLPRAVLDRLVERAPVAVTVAADSSAVVDAAAGLARDLHAPLLLVPEAGPAPSTVAPTAGGETAGAETTGGDGSPDMTVDGLLAGWGTEHVVAVGTPPDTPATVHAVGVEVGSAPPDADAGATASSDGGETETGGRAGDAGPDVELSLPDEVTAMVADAASARLDTPSDLVAVVRPGDGGGDAGTAGGELGHALDLVGGETVAFTGDDPRADDRLRERLSDASTVLLAIPADAWPEGPPRTTVEPDWPALFRIAARAPELVGGGQVLFPERTLVATYGNPAGGALGVLGERDLEGSIAYAEELAAKHEGLFGDSRVQPAFEIIATVASSEPEEDDSYSRKDDLETITEWVDGATDAGLYVVLDLQPGREDFLTQAKRLRKLLRRPNVGLALDPEWRLGPDEVHLDQIGTVTTEEVNEVSEWLAGLVRDEVLPQKLLMIHGFRLSMLSDRQDLAFHAELATMLHVDGQGAQADKDETYAYLTSEGPEELWWGWKNFFDEDTPSMRSPEDTAEVEPTPHVVTYQ